MKKSDKRKADKRFWELLKRISKKEKDALEKFYTLYGKLIYITALTITKSPFLADEIVDDILIKIWQLPSEYSKIKNPRGWLYIITANCAKDKLRQEKKYTELFEMPYYDFNIEKIGTDDAFYKTIVNLSDEEQQIIIFKFIEDMTFEDIAAELQKPLSTVTSTYYRALTKIKK